MYNKYMKISFDPNKNGINLQKHGISLEMASSLEWNTAMTWKDTRFDYGEERYSSLVIMANRLYFVAFTERTDGIRIISLRKANLREVKFYEENS